MKTARLSLVLLLLVLAVSCESLVSAVTNTVAVTVQVSGPEAQLWYGLQEIDPDGEAKNRSMEENRVVQEYQTDELLKLPTDRLLTLPGSFSLTVNRGAKVSLKIKTEGLPEGITLTILYDNKIDRTVRVSNLGMLGHQIVGIF